MNLKLHSKSKLGFLLAFSFFFFALIVQGQSVNSIPGYNSITSAILPNVENIIDSIRSSSIKNGDYIIEKTFYTGERIQEEAFKDNNKSLGPSVFYYPNGDIASFDCNLIPDSLKFHASWYENRNIMSLGLFKIYEPEGIRNGDPKNRIECDTFFFQDYLPPYDFWDYEVLITDLTGKLIRFHMNGKIESERFYYRNHKVYVWSYYDENGILIKQENFF